MTEHPIEMPDLNLVSLELSCYGTEFHDSRRIVEELGCAIQELPSGAWNAEFLGFPEAVKEGELYLAGEVHPTPASEKKASRLHWVLSYAPAPSDSPPARLVDLNARSGGMLSLEEKIVPLLENKIKAMVKARLIVKKADEPLLVELLARRPEAPVSAPAGLQLDSIATSWKLPEAFPKEIMLLEVGAKDLLAVSVHGKMELDRGEFRLSVVRRRTWEVMKPFLRGG